MNKLEKLNPYDAVLAVTGTADPEAKMDLLLMDKLNEAIDHIAALESEVDRLKGHTHDFTSPAASDILNWEQSTTTPPIMETDKQ